MPIFNNRLFQILLFPLSLVYGTIVWLRNKLYDTHIFRSLKIDGCRIISVGNISVGGTGKTPVILFLADYLQRHDRKVAVLSRGYRRKSRGTVLVSDGKQLLVRMEQAGDEAFLLAHRLQNIPVVVDADRYRGARFLWDSFQPDIILLDDGFQHRRLYRNFDIVLVDASVGLNRGLLLPAGFLREPIRSLRRADLIWLTRVDQARDITPLVKQIRRVTAVRIIHSQHQPVKLIQANSGKQMELHQLAQKRVLLFSGIANPTSFEETVRQLGATVAGHFKYYDHFPYQMRNIQKIVGTAREMKVDLVLTTEKDFVRIMNLISNLSAIFYLTIEIQIGNFGKQLQSALSAFLSDGYQS